MHRLTYRIFVLIIIFVLCLSVLPATVSAAPQTHPNTHVNTGDQRADIIAVALTQVGYYEGPNNDTKYGEWYGYNNIGWCGTFVAWCANQAGVPTSVLARTGVANAAAFGLTLEPAGYIPKPGDLFFAKDNSHVGLVYYVEGDYFYTLEGNTWYNGPEGVYIRKRALNSQNFASPKYQGGSDHSYVLASETAHPHKEYYRCSTCGDQYYNGKTVTRDDCTVCIQNNCTHNFSAHSKLSDSQHSRVCSKCGKSENVQHSWNAGVTQKAATCGTAGTVLKTCTACGYESLQTVAATGKHDYTDWVLDNDQTHSRTCNDCNKTEISNHDKSDNWQTDEKQHWFACKTCLEQVEKKDHTFGEECDSPCTVCGYARPDGHQYIDEWQTDDTFHWQICKVCELKKDQAEHVFDAECDDICDTCGFSRETQHSFSNTYSSDLENHWIACTVCGKQKDMEIHSPEVLVREGAMQHCTVCQIPLTAEKDHTHAYDEVLCDSEGHWGICSCGQDMPRQLHQWSVRTQTCSVCNQIMPARQEDFSDLLPWIGIGAGILLVGTILLILILRKKK